MPSRPRRSVAADVSAADLLAAAATARSTGDVDEATVLLVQGFHVAREAGDTDRMVTAALALPQGQRFGTHPGRVPAMLFEAYSAAERLGERARLAAALARAWVYGGDADRAVTYAAEAETLAVAAGDAAVLADALDAALLARWGPDDFDERVKLAARLAEAAAHLGDPDLRLSAELWRLTTAWECLDVVSVQRQLRALDVLAGDSGSARVAFFASARRAMQALATSDLRTADRLISSTRALGVRVSEPDVEAVLHSLDADRAKQAGDLGALRDEAIEFEAYGTAEGIRSVLAEAAVLWLYCGEDEQAARLATLVAGDGLESVPRDVDFLLTVASVVRVAAALEIDDLVVSGARLLEPFAGRSVLNAGAVAFHGVVDDYLFRAHRALGDEDTVRWLHAAATSYRRVGATWWQGQLGGEQQRPRHPRERTVHLHPEATGVWTVGPAGATIALPDLKGLRYLRHLLQHPATDLSALALSAAVSGHPEQGLVPSDAGAVLDEQAIAAYRQRLVEIESDLDEADEWADRGQRERLHLERDALLAEIRGAIGLAGRRRRAGSNHERARVAVRKAIAAALKRIEQHDPSLARLLRETVRTGTTCRYDPDPDRPTTWVLGR